MRALRLFGDGFARDVLILDDDRPHPQQTAPRSSPSETSSTSISRSSRLRSGACSPRSLLNLRDLVVWSSLNQRRRPSIGNPVNRRLPDGPRWVRHTASTFPIFIFCSTQKRCQPSGTLMTKRSVSAVKSSDGAESEDHVESTSIAAGRESMARLPSACVWQIWRFFFDFLPIVSSLCAQCSCFVACCGPNARSARGFLPLVGSCARLITYRSHRCCKRC